MLLRNTVKKVGYEIFEAVLENKNILDCLITEDYKYLAIIIQQGAIIYSLFIFVN